MADPVLESQTDKEHSSYVDARNTNSQPAPHTPFLSEPAYSLAPAEYVTGAVNKSDISGIDTPFVSEYLLGERGFEGHQTLLFRDVMEEIQDEEFRDSLENLIGIVREASESRMRYESSYVPSADYQYLSTYVSPLRDEINATLDLMIHEADGLNEENLTQGQLDSFFDKFETDRSLGAPVFEDFFKKLFKKAKKIAKKGLKVAKRARKIAGKFSPVRLLLGKLRKIVRPLLQRVLTYALNKIPAAYRPMARKLARRYLKKYTSESETSAIPDTVLQLEDALTQIDVLANDPDLARTVPESIAVDLDTLMSGYIIDGESFENDPAVVHFYSESVLTHDTPRNDLDGARQQFIHELVNMEDDADPTPHIEEFVTAILAGLKLGIKLIGRKRVVKYLAKIVARLIRRYVGRASARPLSRALVDAGLKLVNLESATEADRAAADTLAATVEETIERLVAQTPAEVFELEEVLEIHTHEAFEAAAKTHFPLTLLRRDLRTSGNNPGVWVSQPVGQGIKRYKKYSRVMPTTISAEQARHIRTFSDQTLESFLTEQLNVSLSERPLKARVHLYEVLRGTAIGQISQLERDVPGLGSAERSAWVQLHPLTCQTAAMLIPGNASVCRPTRDRYLDDRSRLAVGQRLFFLEIDGVTLPRAPVPLNYTGVTTPLRASEVNLLLNFQRREIVINAFFSERAVQRFVAMQQTPKALAMIITSIKALLTPTLRRILKGKPGHHLVIKREQPAEDDFLHRLAPMLQSSHYEVSQILLRFVVQKLTLSIAQQTTEFLHRLVTASEHPDDGVTLIMKVSQADDLFAILSSNVSTQTAALTRMAAQGLIGSFSFDIKPGFYKF